jgi:protein tyrosine phosphatase (PTP) superfamily phosphohydrolase (DUF442 family)
MFRRQQTKIVAAALLAVLVAGGWSYRQHQRFKHFAVHDPGMVFRAAWLEPDAISELIETHQIRTVVNLCKPGEMGDARWAEEREAVTQAGARLMMEPLSTSIEANDPSVSEQIEILRDPNNYPLLVHCQHGVTRTAKFLLIYDIVFRGMSADDSLETQPLLGRDQHNVNVQAFAKNFELKHRELYPTASADELKILR